MSKQLMICFTVAVLIYAVSGQQKPTINGNHQSTHPTHTLRKCGTRYNVKGRVIGGTASKRGDWPWHVAIFYTDYNNCGGVLISPEWVVTAAHCTDGKDINLMHVILGKHNIKTKFNRTTEQYMNISKLIQHETYDKYRLNNDIALLKLSRPAIFNQYVQPICLPLQNEDIAPGTKGTVTGWGTTTRPAYVPAIILQQVILKVLTYTECLHKNIKYLKVTDRVLCAANVKPKLTVHSACFGDSGGPFASRDRDGKWELHGIVSWGSATCNTTDAYTVFTKVSRYVIWIKTKIRSKTGRKTKLIYS